MDLVLDIEREMNLVLEIIGRQRKKSELGVGDKVGSYAGFSKTTSSTIRPAPGTRWAFIVKNC